MLNNIILHLKCLKCGSHLGAYQYKLAKYNCSSCGQVYHAVDGILDFIGGGQGKGNVLEHERLSSFATHSLGIDFNPRLEALLHDYSLSGNSKINYDLSGNADGCERASMLLDVGCGYGSLLEQAAIKFKVLVGVNIDLEELRVCNRLLQEKGISNPILICASAQNMPFMPAQFPAITCVSVMEHVGDPKNVLNQLKLMLKPQGRLYLGIPNRFSLRTDYHTGLPWIGFLPAGLGGKYASLRGKSQEYQGLNWFSLKDVETLLTSEFGSQYLFIRSGVHKSWLGQLALKVWEVPVLSALGRRLISEFEIIAWA